MIKTSILLLGLTLSASAFSQIRSFQTTRLNGTAGAGVASILSTEAAVLNPASSAYFNETSLSYQSYKTSLRNKNDLRGATGEDFAKHNSTQGYFLSDHSGELKGGLAYLRQDENDYERQSMVFHSSRPMGPRASAGLKYSYMQDKRPASKKPRHEVQHQITTGFTYIVDEETTLGLVVQDLSRTTPGEERTTVGFQYNIASRLTLIADAGYQYTGSITKDYIWSAAAQINVFSDFFIRGGRFYDNVYKLKGYGWGISWIGPKLGVEFSQKTSEQFASSGYILQDEVLVDTSLAAVINF